VVSETTTGQTSTEERITKLEEDQQLADAKIAEQNQLKSRGIKVHALLSGIVLFNTYGERDRGQRRFSTIGHSSWAFSHSAGSFGASVRQSQIGIQAFGRRLPVRVRAQISEFDFAGGFPRQKRGVV